jgi:hypothetical protein
MIRGVSLVVEVKEIEKQFRRCCLKAGQEMMAARISRAAMEVEVL